VEPSSLDRPGLGPEARALLADPWETTPLGPVEAWPEQLRLLVQVMLSSRFPMMIAWGDEYTQRNNVASRQEAVQVVADRLIDEMVGETARDDVALVVKRIH